MNTKIRLAKVNSLAHVIDYDATKIVNTEIFSNDNGAIVMLAFTQGMELPLHNAPADVMIQAVEGKVCFTIDGKEEMLHTGDFMLLKEGTPHEVKALTDVKVLLTKIRP